MPHKTGIQDFCTKTDQQSLDNQTSQRIGQAKEAGTQRCIASHPLQIAHIALIHIPTVSLKQAEGSSQPGEMLFCALHHGPFL